MQRLILAIMLIVMIIVIGPFLNRIKTGELCPKNYLFINGACCLDLDKNRVCDGAEPRLEEPKVIAISPAEERIFTVEVQDMNFYPKELNISAGDTVVWVNMDEKTPHMVFERFNIFRSPRLAAGESFNFTFEEPGEYIYRDVIFVEQMQGVINVKEKPIMLTGSAVKLNQGKIKAVASVVLVATLMLINFLVYRRHSDG